MTEPKYVKISEELRDEAISLIARVNQSYSADRQEVKEVSDQLRAAPSVEMLDLGKVESWLWEDVMALGEVEERFVNLSDLQSLTKPEQSGGMVTIKSSLDLVPGWYWVRERTEDIYLSVEWQLAQYDEGGSFWFPGTERGLDFEELTECVLAFRYDALKAWEIPGYILQHPYPPMQASETRGMDLSGVKRYKVPASFVTGDLGSFIEVVLADDLAPPQQAQQGVSVPTVVELWNAFWSVYDNAPRFREEGLCQPGISAIHNFLIARATKFPKDKP